MNRISAPCPGRGHRAPAAAAIGLLTVATLALTGCSSNTPTAAGVTVTVTTAVPTTVISTLADTGPADPASPATSPGTSATGTSATGTATTGGSLPPLPDELGGLQTLDAAATAIGGDRAKSTMELNAHRKQLTEKAYSEAYGTPSEVQTYASDDLMFLSTVIVVGAASPGLTIGPVSDPADLGLAVNMTTVAQDGQVQCVVNVGLAVPSGQKPDPEKAVTSQCQRTGPGLTVLVFGAGTGTAGHQQMLDLTNAAWTASTGG